MASPTQWTWVWVNSGSWWWIGRPGMLLSMESQRVGHDWATELKWTEMYQFIYPIDGLCCGHYDSWSVGSDQGSPDRNQESTCHNPDGATAARLSPRLCDPWQVAYLLCASVSSSVKQGCLYPWSTKTFLLIRMLLRKTTKESEKRICVMTPIPGGYGASWCQDFLEGEDKSCLQEMGRPVSSREEGVGH